MSGDTTAALREALESLISAFEVAPDGSTVTVAPGRILSVALLNAQGVLDDTHLGSLAEENAELRAEIARLCDPEMKDLRLANGGIEMAVAGPMVQRLALAMTGYFRESGAENYVELGLNARDAPFERYVVTVQKSGALSPHQARAKAEAERDELASLIRSLREANAALAMRLRLAGEAA